MKKSQVLKTTTNPFPYKNTMYNNPTPLEIRILFCYSKEVLMNTYMGNHLIINGDNDSLCAYTKDVFNWNTTKYNVNITNIYTVQIHDLQNNPNSFLYSVGSRELLDDYVNGKYPAINALRNQYNATVVVFETFFVPPTTELKGLSYKTDITSNNEACLCLCRSSSAYRKMNTHLSPTILAHELGHLIGCRHSLEEGEYFEQQYAGSYGHAILKDPTKTYDAKNNPAEYGCIMSYASTVVPLYSNPTKFPYPNPHENTAVGVSGVSEAYKVVEENLPKLAGVFPS